MKFYEIINKLKKRIKTSTEKHSGFPKDSLHVLAIISEEYSEFVTSMNDLAMPGLKINNVNQIRERAIDEAIDLLNTITKFLMVIDSDQFEINNTLISYPEILNFLKDSEQFPIRSKPIFEHPHQRSQRIRESITAAHIIKTAASFRDFVQANNSDYGLYTFINIFNYDGESPHEVYDGVCKILGVNPKPNKK